MQILGVDPRHTQPHKINPPHPLPHVSRRALKRVKDRLEPPTRCNLCDNPVRLARNRGIYGQDYGDWPFVYLCRGCGAYVGLHADTDLPLGTLADRDMREARKHAKNLFMSITKKKFKRNRDTAYEWLAGEIGIAKSHCHFALFTTEQAHEAARACAGLLN